MAQKNYTENDVKKLKEVNLDLETTLDINKQLIQTLMMQQVEITTSEAAENP